MLESQRFKFFCLISVKMYKHTDLRISPKCHYSLILSSEKVMDYMTFHNIQAALSSILLFFHWLNTLIVFSNGQLHFMSAQSLTTHQFALELQYFINLVMENFQTFP